MASVNIEVDDLTEAEQEARREQARDGPASVAKSNADLPEQAQNGGGD